MRQLHHAQPANRAHNELVVDIIRLVHKRPTEQLLGPHQLFRLARGVDPEPVMLTF
jgi:hypothetical protein